jgi:5-methyltetrahydrofolate--homocysteine methyltransferase
MNQTILQSLAEGNILIADGATGTMLMQSGLPAGAPPELWNEERPEAVIQLHQAYLNAGSQIILTNTFGGSRIKLGKAGYANKTRQFNRAAAELAQKAADGSAYVAGDLGPTGEMMAPFGTLTYEFALEVFQEQAEALVAGGVDFLWIETMSDLEEARAAINAAHTVTDLPLFCSLSFSARGRTMMGVNARQAVDELWQLGLSAIGANCGKGLDIVAEVLPQFAEQLPGVPLIAKPNAGLPRLVDGQTIYDTPPDAFAARIDDFIGMGARIVGACCGSNPEYIAAIKSQIASAKNRTHS